MKALPQMRADAETLAIADRFIAIGRDLRMTGQPMPVGDHTALTLIRVGWRAEDLSLRYIRGAA